jgi:CspA family cold shock protein
MTVSSDGVVLTWNDEHGWGILRSEDVPGDVWVHFSAVRGGASLEPGSRVRFRWEEASQDGFAFRAVEVFPAEAPDGTPPEPSGPANAYHSSLVIDFDSD